MTMHARQRLLILLLAVPLIGHAETSLEKVIDGDTVLVNEDGARYKLRLRHIDAPELQQAYGKQAQRHLKQVCSGEIAIHLEGVDRYQRRLGDLYCDGVDAASTQVAQGFAWVDTRYTHDTALLANQTLAQQQKRGLWAMDQALPPWQWRKQFGHYYHGQN